ncbi:MAG: N-6 DNA methylase (plasmid) [Candidatus Manganitrophus sp.]|nr:MAG: N-6 DNA methylase [Candidatus Manganitrophus sp.]
MDFGTIHNIEEHRIEEQTRLDGLKTAAERNQWGQFATPHQLALSIARHACTLMEENSSVRFFDPALGTGAFFSALSAALPAERIKAATGIELDPLFAKSAMKLWAGSGLKVTKGDFTRQSPPSHRFNLILTNPPYVRHHHLSAEDKERFKNKLTRMNLHISGLAGLYCYFLLFCHDWMEEGGLAAWLIPSEFMDVNYGVTLRRYLTERVTLLQIHRFCPTDVQFTDALVSSAVVIFRKSPPLPDHAARFSFAGPIDNPRSAANIPLKVLQVSRKWTQFPINITASVDAEHTLGDLFTIKRGLATGANDFFILSESDIREWKIPSSFLKPILPSPRYIKTSIIDALPNGAPNLSPRLYLLDCDVPEKDIKAHWPRFYEYLKQGKRQKVNESYLSSRREPWYSQEKRPPSPFLCTYMGRTRNGKHPFRFLWNRSEATAHNVYLMLYPKGRLLEALRLHPQLEEQVFEALQRITPAQLLSEGRVYGGGLHKVEPKELAQISARQVLDAIEAFVSIEKTTLFA